MWFDATMPPLLSALLCLDILLLLERPRWRQSGKPQLSLNTFFNFLVPEDWVFLSWLEAGQFMRSWILLFWFMAPLWRLGPLGWMSDLRWLPRALESERKFPRSRWNLESEAKIYSSLSSSSIPSRVIPGNTLIFEFPLQHFCIGTKPTTEGLS